MPYHIVNSTPLSQLVELSAEVTETEEGTKADVKVTLQIQPDEVDLGEFSVEIQIHEAFLVLTADGNRTEQTSKHGMRNAGERVAGKKSIEKSVSAGVNRSVAIEGIAEAIFSGIDANLKASMKGSRSVDEKREASMVEKHEVTYEHIPVEAIGNDRWKVSEESRHVLRGYYLTDARLCVLTKNPGRPNNIGVQLSLKVKPKDIDVDVIKDRRVIKLSTNKQKLLSILAAKHLRELTSSDEEILTMANSKGHYEG